MIKQNSARAANVAAVAIIVAAGLLSTAWVFLVPIFQATDEAAHYDYSMGIFAAGHLIRTQDRPRAWIATPYARYLLGATDYFRIAFHSSMRAPHGYGTPAYYRRLDAGAPRLRPPIDSGEMSYIGYPFGFYALEAIVEKATATVTGSLTATFFAARLFCVFLTMLGLYFNYRTALNIGVSKWNALALTIATAFFPLTTLVSSYVQPDNLSYALVAAALFLATQFKRTSRPKLILCCLAIVLGALAVTKYQFFVSVVLPVAAVVAFCPPTGVRLRTTVARLLALAIPAILLLSVQVVFVSAHRQQPPTQSEFGASQGILATIGGVLQGGPASALSYFALNSLNAFKDFYVSGPNSATYWGALGLWDVPLIVGTPSIEFLLRILISVASVTVVTIIVYRVLVIAARLARIASRGRRATALRLACSDPLFNSYVLFTVLLFGLYAATSNIFGAVGRQWYPYNFAAFLCAAWYAPRSFKGFPRRTPGVLAVVLAVYSLLASAYATEEIVKRYYGPQIARYTTFLPKQNQIVRDGALGTLWTIQGMDFHPLFAKRYRTTFQLGSRLWAGGAAIFPSAHQAANTVAVVIDGRLPARVLAGQYNFQIAEATRDLTYGYSGYFAPFDSDGLSEGPHLAVAYAQLPGREQFQKLSPDREFFLAAQGTTLSASFRRRLKTAPMLKGTAKLHVCGPLLAVNGPARGLANGKRPLLWAESDGRPYLALFNDHTRRFLSAVPLSDFSAGRHTITIYVTYASATTLQVAPTLSFNVQPGSNRADTLFKEQVCSAAEHLIAGT